MQMKCIKTRADGQYQQIRGNYGAMTCGDNHCFGTYFLHLQGTELGCRGCAVSWALWTDRWPGSCESLVGSEAVEEEHLHLEAGEISRVQKEHKLTPQKKILRSLVTHWQNKHLIYKKKVAV